MSRRNFLAGMTTGTLGALTLGSFTRPAFARELEKAQKRVLMVWLHGGSSQLETWDPKPGTNTGGPFQTIPTSVPGIHICELLPHTARLMHRLALVRGVNTAEDDHGKGAYIMHTGRRQEPAMKYPHLGSVCAKLLGDGDNPLPGYIHITPRGNGGVNSEDAAFLGPRFASVSLGDGHAPANLDRPPTLTEIADAQRHTFRMHANERFNRSRRTAQTEAYTQSYDQAAQLMRKRALFDITKEPPQDRRPLRPARLRPALPDGPPAARRRGHVRQGGAHQLRHAPRKLRLPHRATRRVRPPLRRPARRPARPRPARQHARDRHVGVRPHAAASTAITAAITGRRPGRSPWRAAASTAAASSGKTNANGTAVTDRQVNGGHLFHTYLRALGLDPKKNYYVNQRPIPMADPKASAIKEVLA